ncbi:hypothetical protein Tco_1355704 [Tanacetum coccineum]
MATLEFYDKHNMVAYLEKPEVSVEFHQIIDFLTASHIHYVLTKNPTIYTSFIKQFWTTTTAGTTVNGEVELTASIDGQAKTIIEASLRRHLKLEDNGGISSLPNTEIFEQLPLMGYATDSDKLTFQKEVNIGKTKLSTVKPKLSTDSTKIESMKLEAMEEERRIFKCWFYNHTTNGHQFTMSNRHQELASPEQTATGKELSNPFMAGSLPKTTKPT